MEEKDYTQRPNVIRFLAHWQAYLLRHGNDKTYNMLNKSRTTMLNRKDEKGLIQALGVHKPKGGFIHE